MTEKPNLFAFATSELSQDAAIAWLLSWADPALAAFDSELCMCSQRLLSRMFSLHNVSMPDPIEKLVVYTQTNHIDILCIVNDVFALLIEDKTATEEHGDQLSTYIKEVINRKFERKDILPIYFKTHEQGDFSEVTKHGYKVFSRCDFLAVLTECQSTNDILTDLRQTMVDLDTHFGSYQTLPLNQWHGQSWIGFYQELKRALNIQQKCWQYVPNRSGGFWGFWWCWPHDPEQDCHVYLQLEQAKFCFKVSEITNTNPAVTRDKWYGLIVKHAPEHGFRAIKPARFGVGDTMTVAILDGEYRVANRDGLLDFARTVDFVKRIESGFTEIVSQHAQLTFTEKSVTS